MTDTNNIEVDVTPVEEVAKTPSAPVHVMVDLETWGTGNDAVIVSIGACKFDRDTIIDRFHTAIDPGSCQAYGLTINADTILWWMDPDQDEARRNWLAQERVELASALIGFQMWLASSGILAVWGNGSTFDNVILRSAFAATGQQYPVRFWQDMCYRTMKQLTPNCPLVREGTHHNALDDAVSQAKHLQAIWQELDPDALREMLDRCRQQFEFYGKQHRAKGTPEADGKAVVNEQFAADIRQLLDGGPGATA